MSALEEELSGRVTNEKELFLTLHMFIPLLQRVADAKEKAQIDIVSGGEDGGKGEKREDGGKGEREEKREKEIEGKKRRG